MSRRNKKTKQVEQGQGSATQREIASNGAPKDGSLSEVGGTPTAKPSWDFMTVFTGILALFAVLSFIALLVQLHDARKALILDERPYVWMANETKEYPNFFASVITNQIGTRQITATMRYTNFGKSPAILLRSYHGMILGPSAGQIKAQPWVESRAVLPTDKVDFFSAVSGTATDTEINSYLTADEGKGITVYATWQYTDTTGNKYETEICMTRLNLGSFAYCTEHNDIKDCSEFTCEQ